MQRDPTIQCTVEDGVAVLTLNRPHRKNAFTLPMVDAWADRLGEAGSDDSVGAIARTDLATALALAGSHMGVVMTMSDHAEGVAALREHRTATFTGQ